MKRFICAVLVLAILSMVPIMMSGCEEPQREVTIERKLEVKTEPDKPPPPPGPKIIVE